MIKNLRNVLLLIALVCFFPVIVDSLPRSIPARDHLVQGAHEVQRVMRSVAPYMPLRLPVPVVAWLAWLVLYLFQAIRTGQVSRAIELPETTLKSAGVRPNRYELKGHAGPSKTLDFVNQSLCPYMVARTIGWLPKLLCLAVTAFLAWYAAEEWNNVASMVTAAVGFVVFLLMLFGRLHVATSSGHIARYMGFQCAARVRELAGAETQNALRVQEASVVRRIEAALNISELSAAIHRRTIAWAWLILAVALFLGPYWITGYSGHDFDVQTATNVARGLGALCGLIGIVLSLIPHLQLQFAGGGVLNIYRVRNIRMILEAMESASEITWIRIDRTGLFGPVRYRINANALALIGTRSRFHFVLILVSFGLGYLGTKVENPGLWIAAAGVLILAIFLSIPRARYYLRGGFVHGFISGDSSPSADSMQ